MKEEFKGKGTSLRESRRHLKESLMFSRVEEIATELKHKLEASDVGVEEVKRGYLEDVRCVRLFTKNLNPYLIGILKSICQIMMVEYPELAIEIEPSEEYGYFYGREICIMIASEWYLD